jgi:hypothetical protein
MHEPVQRPVHHVPEGCTDDATLAIIPGNKHIILNNAIT